jgi:putative Mg2+ transporter-C (MgtC) family protein
MDPTRLGAQVISGIGFLGAGTIIREGAHVRGLTTAAGLWVVACVGIAVGAGFYEGAIISTAFIYLTLITLKTWHEKFKMKESLKVICVNTIDIPGQIGAIGNVFGKYGISIKNMEFIKSEVKEAYISIRLYALMPGGIQLLEFMKELNDLKGVEKVYEI